MSLDLDKVGQLAAALFEMLEGDYDGRDPELRAALVAVDLGVTGSDGEHWTHVRWHFAHAPDWNHNTASSAYLAGVAAQLLEGGDNEE